MKKLLLAALLAVSCAASATTLTFDDLPAGAVPSGYGGLNWSNFYVLDAVSYVNSGYKNGIVSPRNVLYNGGGSPAGFSSATPFTFNSAYLTAAWNDGLTVLVTGYLNNVAIDVESITLDTNAPTLETFNWSNIDRVGFVSSGGTHNSGFNGYGEHFATDNLTLNASPVPEPASLALFGLGLLSFAASRRKSAK